MTAVSYRQSMFCDSVDQDVLTRKVQEEVINFPHLRDEHRAVLQTTAALGPDAALKEHALTKSGDPEKNRNRDLPRFVPRGALNCDSVLRSRERES